MINIFIPFRNILFSICLVAVIVISNGKDDNIIDRQNSQDSSEICYKSCLNESTGYLETYCTGQLAFNNSHCCKNTSSSTEPIVGIDIRGCNLTGIKSVKHFISSLVVISLEDNPITSIDINDFYGLQNVQYLSLPLNLDCPGGEKAWSSVQRTNISTVCHNQINICLYTDSECPPNSQCVNTVPGSFECHCLQGYYGYKCLRKGIFPITYYAIGFAATTVVLSVLLWVLQRRHVKYKPF